MTVIIDGTNGVQSVGGSASTASFTKDGDTNNGIFFPATDVTAITTAGTERLRIDASGNAGLGVTPSAWGSIFNAMQLGDGGFIAGRSDVATQLQLGCNGFYDGSNFKYIATGTATRYYMDTGAHYWEKAASGTAGNTITFTQAMTLDASGRLGIGTTSPAAPLHVKVATNANFTAQNTSGVVQLQAINDAASAFTQLDIAGSFITLSPGSTERARISSGGSLLVGTNSDFAFSGTTFINSSTTNCIFANTTAGAGTGYLLFQGRSGAANVNTAGTTVFSVTDNGNVTNTNNSYGAISDEKLKQDIVDAASQWDDIKGLRVRKFRYKAAPAAPLQIGLIAQEAETVSPGLVEEIFDQEEVEVVDESGNVKKEARIAETSTKSVKYSVLYMKAVKALQEAMSRIESLEARVAALEEK